MISMKCTDRPAFLREFADLYHQEQYFSNISVHQSHPENVNSDMAGTHRQGVWLNKSGLGPRNVYL